MDVRIELPAGTQLATTAEVLRDASDRLLEMPEVRTVITSIGRQRWTTQSNLGEIKVLLVDQGDRYRSTEELTAVVRQMRDDPDLVVDVTSSGGGPGGMRMGGGWGAQVVQLTLVGPDMERLREISYRIEDRLLQEENVISVNNPRVRPVPELEDHLARECISRIGVSSSEIASSFGAQSRGSRVGVYGEGGRENPIEVRNSRDRFESGEDLFSLELLQVADVRFPITAIGRLQLA